VDKKTILVVAPLLPECNAELCRRFPEAEFIFEEKPTIYSPSLQKAQIVIGNIGKGLLWHMPKLEWLQLWTSGTNHYTDPGVVPNGVKLTTATGSFGLGMAEFMVGMVFCLAKKLHIYRDDQKQSLWREEGDLIAIDSSTTLCLGMGDIGSHFCARMKALGSHVIGIRRVLGEKPDFVDEQATLADLDALLPQADVVAMCLPSTSLTDGILDAKRISLLKRSAIVVNVGRGAAIDTEALADALEENRIYGAALDVVDPEPLPEDHRLWGMENVIITPHVSGEVNIPQTWQRMMDVFYKNLANYFGGRPLINEVDPETTYSRK